MRPVVMRPVVMRMRPVVVRPGIEEHLSNLMRWVVSWVHFQGLLDGPYLRRMIGVHGGVRLY